MAEKLAIAVIGAGTMAGRHMRTLKQSLNSRLVAVMDVDAQRAKAVGEEHGVKAYNDLDSVLGDPDVERWSSTCPTAFMRRSPSRRQQRANTCSWQHRWR